LPRRHSPRRRRRRPPHALTPRARMALRYAGVMRSRSLAILLLALGPALPVLAQSPLRVQVTLAPGVIKAPLDGRVDLFISRDGAREPRFQISDQIETQQMFGLNVEHFAPGSVATFDAKVL